MHCTHCATQPLPVTTHDGVRSIARTLTPRVLRSVRVTVAEAQCPGNKPDQTSLQLCYEHPAVVEPVVVFVQGHNVAQDDPCRFQPNWEHHHISAAVVVVVVGFVSGGKQEAGARK